MVSNVEKQITEDQHFVPRFYLKKFANNKNELERLDLKERKIIDPRGPKGICCEDFFYGMETGKQDELSQQVENTFQLMENWTTKNIDTCIEKILDYQHIFDNEKWEIAFLMSMLWIRGPAMRKQINRMSEDVFKKISLFHFSHPNIDEWFDNFDKNTGSVTSPEMRKLVGESMTEGKFPLQFNNYFHLSMFDSFKGFANCFFGQYWIIYISKSNKKFTTSDNPLTVVLPERKGFYGPGILERIHYFPLTPDIFIVASNPEADFGKKLRRKTLFQANDKEILDLNIITSSRALQYAYAKDRQSLEDILGSIECRERLLDATRDKILKIAIARTKN